MASGVYVVMRASIEERLFRAGVKVMTAHLISEAGPSWQATLRRDSGWTVGGFCENLDDAVDDALAKFCAITTNKPYASPWPPKARAEVAPPYDDLEGLLG